MPLAPIGETELHYRVHGDHGPALLLIMGFGAGAAEWDALATDLAQDHRVLAFDHAGLGGSGPVPHRLDMPTLVGHVDALLDHVGWSQAHVAGMSMGGMVAQHYALDRPARVRSASLLVSSAHGPTALRTTRAAYRKLPRLVVGNERARARAVAELLHGSLGESRIGVDALVEKQLRLVGFAPFRVLRAHWRAILGHDTRARLPGLDLRVPMLVVGASEDNVIPSRETDRLAGLLPAARLRWIDGAGHNVHQDATPEVAGELRQLVRSVEGRRVQAG